VIKFTAVDSIHVTTKIPKDWPQGKTELCFLRLVLTCRRHTWGVAADTA